MFGESTRLESRVITVLLGTTLWCGMATAQTVPPASSKSPASAPAVEVEARIEATLRALPSMSPEDVARTLQDLLHNDVSKVNVVVLAEAYNALAASYEKLAHDSRSDKLNPAAGHVAENYIDAGVESYVKAGKAAYAAGDMNSATTAFNRALSYRPGSEEALLGMARVYGVSGRSLQAIERYQDYFRATKRGPLGTYEPSLYIEIARVYLGANLWNQAVKSLHDAVKNGGDTDEVASLLSEAYLGLGRPDAALAQIERAIAKNPAQPLYYARYAQILLQQKSLAQAAEKAASGIEIARARLRANPDDLKLMETMGQCYDVFIKVLSTILAGDPNQTKARLVLVACLQEQADLAQLMALHRALGVIQIAPEADRDNVPLLEKQVGLEMAVHHRNLRQTCERLLRVDPDNKLAKEVLAKLGSEPGRGK